MNYAKAKRALRRDHLISIEVDRRGHMRTIGTVEHMKKFVRENGGKYFRQLLKKAELVQ